LSLSTAGRWCGVQKAKSSVKQETLLREGHSARKAFPARQSYPTGLLFADETVSSAGEAIFHPREVILKQASTSMKGGCKREFPAMKKRQDFITSMLSRWALHLMAIAYAGCEIISRS
jgi:hypothetical protein